MSWSLTPDSPHWVYELFDTDGRYLYIGCTAQPENRLGGHKFRKDWWGEVSHMSLTKYINAAEGFAAESAAIRANQPKYNVQLTTTYGAGGWATRRTNAQQLHQRGEACRPTMGCRQCNAARRNARATELSADPDTFTDAA